MQALYRLFPPLKEILRGITSTEVSSLLAHTSIYSFKKIPINVAVK